MTIHQNRQICDHGNVINSSGTECLKCVLRDEALRTEADRQRLLSDIMFDVDKAGFKMMGEDMQNASEDEFSTARWVVMIHLIQRYAHGAGYNSWELLAQDIGESFDNDWINPTEEQMNYMAAQMTVRNFERNNTGFGQGS